MEAISKSLLALLFVGAFTLSLNAKEIAPELTLKKEIKAMMSGVEIPNDKVFEAEVEFLVNHDNQIVIVSIETDQNFIERVIKSRLNYQTVKSEEATPNKINKVKLILKGA